MISNAIFLFLLKGEYHVNNPEMSKLLHKAVRSKSESAYAVYQQHLANRPVSVSFHKLFVILASSYSDILVWTTKEMMKYLGFWVSLCQLLSQFACVRFFYLAKGFSCFVIAMWRNQISVMKQYAFCCIRIISMCGDRVPQWFTLFTLG